LEESNVWRFNKLTWAVVLTWVMLLVSGTIASIDIIGFRSESAWLSWVSVSLFIISVILLTVSTRGLGKYNQLESARLRELFQLLSDGIVVMDPNRVITFINPAAVRLTGWQLQDVIPYCTYCQSRNIESGEQRCLLAAQPHRHYFESQLPTKRGEKVDVGMSRTFLSRNQSNQRNMVITIRDVTLERQEEALKLSRRLTQHTLEVQEEERRRLSQELHDGISQTLYGVSLGLEHLQRRVEEPAHNERIAQLYQQIHMSIDEIRSLSRSLYPAVLYDLGLLSALRTLTDGLTSQGRKIEFVTDLTEEDSISASASGHIYRIVQEAIHNAIQHGRATHVIIRLVRADGDFTLQITDNGKGFPVQELPEGQGYGINNMEERARVLHAHFEINSQLNRGTDIILSIPAKIIEKANA
jgi:two-component system sensor histidine kinase NreB